MIDIQNILCGAWSIHKHDYRFVEDIIYKVPIEMRKYVRFMYNKLAKISRYEANIFLLEVRDKINSVKFKITLDDDGIKDLAENKSKEYAFIIIKSKKDSCLIKRLEKITTDFGILPPLQKFPDGIFARYRCPRWWKRRIREKQLVVIEELASILKIINKKMNIYASDLAVSIKMKQLEKNKNILKKLEATNEEGKSLSLYELSQKSVANPGNRKAEILAQIYGYKELAKESNHNCLFITITCPSRMHSFIESSGQENPKYDGTKPKETHEYLVQVWERIRKSLFKKGIKLYGLRAQEPSHDGTLHSHLLVFLDPTNEDIIKNTFKKYSLKSDSEEENVSNKRLKIINVNKNDDRAINYILKFIGNNDQDILSSDIYGTMACGSSYRVKAFLSIHKIHQFQFFGGPAISIWRELRRIKTTNKKKFKPFINAAVDGDWAKFIKLMGGLFIKRDDQKLKLHKVWSDELNYYKEPKGFQVFGVEIGDMHIISRVHTWTIDFINKIENRINASKKFIYNCPPNIIKKIKKSFGNSLTN